MSVSRNGRSYWLNDDQVAYVLGLVRDDIHENDSCDEDEEKMRQQLRVKLEVRVGPSDVQNP